MKSLDELANIFEYWAGQPLEKTAKAMSKKKKLDPKAKVRNRGKCVFPTNSSKVNDDKDHYPIPDEAHGRSALSYAGKQKSAPWYNGTVEEMQKAVERAVHKAFPGIGKDTKKESELVSGLIKEANVGMFRNAIRECENGTEILDSLSEAMKMEAYAFDQGDQSPETQHVRSLMLKQAELLGKLHGEMQMLDQKLAAMAHDSALQTLLKKYSSE